MPPVVQSLRCVMHLIALVPRVPQKSCLSESAKGAARMWSRAMWRGQPAARRPMRMKLPIVTQPQNRPRGLQG
jgi:hypothetical protein